MLYRSFFLKSLIQVPYMLFREWSGGGDNVLRKKQVVTLVSIAVVSFLIGTMFNVTVATDGGNPFNKMWEAISVLQGQVTELEAKPQVITVTGHSDPFELISGVIADLLYVPNVTVSKGANVFAIASGRYYCIISAQSPLGLRHRANDTYAEWFSQGFTDAGAGGTNKETVEFHHAWTNLTAGTYTFAVQYYVTPTREVYIHHSRLTLIIF